MADRGQLFCDDSLSYRNTLVIRFIMMVCIVAYHGGQYFHFQFPDCGHLCVAVFFFMSGYGLEISRSSKPGYMRSFLQKRVLGTMIQYWIILMIIALVVMLMQFDLDLLYSNVSNAFLRNPWWFITELVVFYVIYYLAQLVHSKPWRYASILFFDCVFMLMMTDYFGMDVYLKSGLCFIFGLLWYEGRSHVTQVMHAAFPAVAVLCIAVLAYPIRSPNDVIDMFLCGAVGIAGVVLIVLLCTLNLRKAFPIHIAVMVLGAVMVVFQMGAGLRSEGAVMIFLAGVCGVLCQIGSFQKALAFLGAASLEMYLMQFMFFQVPDLDSMMTDLYATILVLLLMIAVSLPTHELCKKTMKVYEERLEKLEGWS